MKKLQNITDTIRLSPEQKNIMWSNIIDKIELSEKSLQENVRMDGDKRHTPGAAYSKLSSLFPNQKYMVTKIIASVLLVGLMGTSFAAENALPGDALYLFKVEVNESLRGAFTFGAEADAKWEIAKIERRAQEQAELEARSHTTAATQAQIQTRSQDSAEKVREVIIRLQTEGKAEAATSLEGGLNTAINAILEADTRKSETSDDIDVSSDVDAEVDSDIEVNILDDDTLELKGNTQSEVRSETKSKNDSTASSLKSDLDIQGGLGLSGENR